MNAQTQIEMDPELQERARAKAAELGVTLPEYIQRLVMDDLSRPAHRSETSEPKPNVDISVIFDLVKDGPVTNIARDKHEMIGEAAWEDHLRSVGRRRDKRDRSKG